MSAWVDFLLVLIVLTNLRMLGGSRLISCIQGAGAQGLLVGLLVLAAHAGRLDPRVVALAVTITTLKGVAFPWLLTRAVRETRSRREVEPFVGYIASLIAGVLLLLFGIWLSGRLPLPSHVASPLGGPVAFSTALIGLFLVVSRRKALMQVVGYLVLENGIFMFGVLFVRETPWLMELGVMLDLLVGVFVMGITIFHINETFDHIDTDRLASGSELDREGGPAADGVYP